MRSSVLLLEGSLKPVLSMGIPVPPLLGPDKGHFCLISMHNALPCNLTVCWAQSYRLKVNAVANFAGGISHIGEVVLVTRGRNEPTIVEDNLFILIRIEILAFFTIETSKRLSIQEVGCF